jgi:hypothetical protein
MAGCEHVTVATALNYATRENAKGLTRAIRSKLKQPIARYNEAITVPYYPVIAAAFMPPATPASTKCKAKAAGHAIFLP